MERGRWEDQNFQLKEVQRLEEKEEEDLLYYSASIDRSSKSSLSFKFLHQNLAQTPLVWTLWLKNETFPQFSASANQQRLKLVVLMLTFMSRISYEFKGKKTVVARPFICPDIDLRITINLFIKRISEISKSDY